MDELDNIKDKFEKASEKNQLLLVDEIITKGEKGYQFLRDFLVSTADVSPIRGKIYQVLRNSNTEENDRFLRDKFPEGLVELVSEKNIEYRELQQLLVERKYQEADSLTREKLCELAGEGAVRRKWVYFTEVKKFPVADLKTIDTLWYVYSEGKFGYKIQRQIWLSLGKDYNQLWVKLKWKKGNKWTKYPGEFIWDLSAPPGHLPLSNQLRGVRFIDALFSHPAWENKSK
ncbi:MAG: GUN4 domain-containing protein [Geminocystis sp.]|nr:GUN4 domain-containing protein [Geminocystis sp.]HIK36974.1 GUN4 N-terminal ARM-like repeat domain-containing protein [Geminocystis sp. M7585_C2015_104]MCS7147105.1 GUN4 domain-containing protein [Geminocystis sp.]MCX8079146.1 GUN4 domain-containing protein [Geminocystis sp.]MDW8116741.1 GUN4 N-terminal ARM-like repeat domain-containing protein [Geminocystis sp.]